jgi:hypothetical protein
MIELATSNGTKKLSEPLFSRFRVMYLNEYESTQFSRIVKTTISDLGYADFSEWSIAHSGHGPHWDGKVDTC